MNKNLYAIYPWDKWMNRKTPLKLVRGRDYHCQPHSMAQQCRNAAGRYGVSISVSIEDGTITVRVV